VRAALECARCDDMRACAALVATARCSAAWPLASRSLPRAFEGRDPLLEHALVGLEMRE